MHHNCSNPADCWCEVKRLLRVLWITLVIFGLEVTGGLISGSLALLADAGHVFVDKVAIIVAIAAAILVKYGFDQNRVHPIGFRINIALLWLVVGWILFEAYGRFKQPENINSGIMTAAAAAGMLGNLIQHRILEGSPDEHKHQIHESLSMHVLSDLIQSGGVVAGAVIMLLTGWLIIDAVLSISIALWIAWQITSLMRKTHRP